MTTVFSPTGATVNLAVTSTTGNVAMTIMGGMTQQGSRSIRVYNSGAVDVFIAIGSSAITATTSSLPIPAGAVEVFETGPSATHIAAITASSTATVYFTSGRGA
jgi:hypothetical protein